MSSNKIKNKLAGFVVKETEQKEAMETGAQRNSRVGKGRFDLIPVESLTRLAKHYEAGASMHGERNWEKGMYYSRLLDSAMRHISQFMSGDTEEDHLAAACWNLFAIMHFQKYGTLSLDDRPSYISNDSEYFMP